MSERMEPLRNRVLIRKHKELGEKKLPSGLVIFEKDTGAGNDLARGTVVAVGPGRWDKNGKQRVPMDVKVGDVVLFSHVPQYDLVAWEENGEQVLVKPQQHLAAIIEPDDKPA